MVKIENSHLNRIANNQTTNAQQIDKQHRMSDRSNEELSSIRDEAQLSERARLLVKIRTNLDETSDVRSDKVEFFRKQIETDTYEVPIEALVQKLIERFKFS